MRKKLSYQRDTNVSASIPEWLSEAIIIAASNAGCSRSELVADLICSGLTGINLMEHEGKYRRHLLGMEVSKLSQHYSSIEGDK